MNDIIEHSTEIKDLTEIKENMNKLMQLVSTLNTKTAQLQVRINTLERYIYDEDKDISEE